MFSTLPNLNFNISLTFILSSANAFNLDQSKILSFGKGINDLYVYKSYKFINSISILHIDQYIKYEIVTNEILSRYRQLSKMNNLNLAFLQFKFWAIIKLGKKKKKKEKKYKLNNENSNIYFSDTSRLCV